jgi:hypothetical protein
MNFRVGQKVVCVDDARQPLTAQFTPNMPARGSVYTVRALDYCAVSDTQGIFLTEIVNPVFDWANAPRSELAFKSTRFRPVKTTSIECFKALLAPVPKKQKERV